MAKINLNQIIATVMLLLALIILPIPGVDLLDIPAVIFAGYLLTRKKKLIG